jgi:transcriptional regulator with XRE-family HTH domain
MNNVAANMGLLPRLRAWFGLSQHGLGQCLGLSKMMVSQVERGVRGLPGRAAMPQAALTLALHSTPTDPAPEPVDASELRQRQQACQLRANQLAFELSGMLERATWARRRLAALPTLLAALAAPGTEPPVWLVSFEAEARQELARSGTTAQALLRLRLAALTAEVAEAEQVLGTTSAV